MNVYLMSTPMSTTALELELQAAISAGARPATIQAIKNRLQIARDEDITNLSHWPDSLLLKRYAQATAACDRFITDLFSQTNSPPNPALANQYDAALKIIELIEDEGKARNLSAFIITQLPSQTCLNVV